MSDWRFRFVPHENEFAALHEAIEHLQLEFNASPGKQAIVVE